MSQPVVTKGVAPPTDDTYTECMFVIDDRKKNEEVVCGVPGVVEILVRNDFGLFAVHLCDEHKREHREFYKNRNRVRSRPRRHS